MNLNVAAPIHQAATRLRTRRGAICASPAFAADLAQLAANIAAPVPSNVPASPMRGALGASPVSSAAASPLRPRLARRNALTPTSRRELRVMLQLPVSPAPSPMASPLGAPSLARSVSASFALRATPDSERSSASSETPPLHSRRGSVVSSTDETPGSSSVFSPRASAVMSFFGAASPRADSPSTPQQDSEAMQFIPQRVRNLERRRAIINHSEFFATIPEQWQDGAVPAPTSPRIRARRPSSPFLAAASAAVSAAAAGSRSIFQVLTSIPPMTLAPSVHPNSSPIEGAMDGAFVSPMWSPSPK